MKEGMEGSVRALMVKGEQYEMVRNGGHNLSSSTELLLQSLETSFKSN